MKIFYITRSLEFCINICCIIRTFTLSDRFVKRHRNQIGWDLKQIFTQFKDIINELKNKLLSLLDNYIVISFPEHHRQGWKFCSTVHGSLQSLIRLIKSIIFTVVWDISLGVDPSNCWYFTSVVGKSGMSIK